MGHTKSALPFSIDQELTVTTEHMLFGNECVARVDYPDTDSSTQNGSKKIAVFINGGAPGETAVVRISQIEKRFLRAQLVRILEPSHGRVEPECPVFATCGGCQWQHLNYDTQVEEKKLILERFIQKGLGLSVAPNSILHKAPSPWNYRRRVQARYDRNGVGFFVEHTRTIAYTETCAIAHPAIQAEWRKLDQNLRNGKTIVTDTHKIEWTHYDDRSPIRTVIDRRHSSDGFVQINHEQNAVMQKIVYDNLKAKIATSDPNVRTIVLDLYGGRGNLVEHLLHDESLRSSNVLIISVDSANHGLSPADFKAAIRSGTTTHSNQTAPGRTVQPYTKLEKPAIVRHVIVQQEVESFLRDKYFLLDANRDDLQLIVVADPPRGGLENASALLADLPVTTFLAFSCDPSTLSRDLEHFRTKTLQSLHLIDMFPQTYHIECCAILCQMNI